MAKGLRSNNKKALRTVRRKTLAENPAWLEEAEKKRYELLARISGTAKPDAQVNAGPSGMDVEAPAADGSEPNVPQAEARQQVEPNTSAVKTATSSGGIRVPLTKKKKMKLQKLKKQRQDDAWKSGKLSAFHSKAKRQRKKL